VVSRERRQKRPGTQFLDAFEITTDGHAIRRRVPGPVLIVQIVGQRLTEEIRLSWPYGTPFRRGIPHDAQGKFLFVSEADTTRRFLFADAKVPGSTRPTATRPRPELDKSRSVKGGDRHVVADKAGTHGDGRKDPPPQRLPRIPQQVCTWLLIPELAAGGVEAAQSGIVLARQ